MIITPSTTIPTVKQNPSVINCCGFKIKHCPPIIFLSDLKRHITFAIRKHYARDELNSIVSVAGDGDVCVHTTPCEKRKDVGGGGGGGGLENWCPLGKHFLPWSARSLKRVRVRYDRFSIAGVVAECSAGDEDWRGQIRLWHPSRKSQCAVSHLGFFWGGKGGGGGGEGGAASKQ